MDDVTVAQAQRILGFTPAIPAYLPGGYEPPHTLNVYNPPMSASWWRIVKDNGPLESSDRISLLESRVPGHEYDRQKVAIGDQTPTRVAIATVQGVWLRLPGRIENSHDGTRRVVFWRHDLIWNRDGMHFDLAVPDNMDLGEAVKIAESLH